MCQVGNIKQQIEFQNLTNGKPFFKAQSLAESPVYPALTMSQCISCNGAFTQKASKPFHMSRVNAKMIKDANAHKIMLCNVTG